jgi:hypothetical protein
MFKKVQISQGNEAWCVLGYSRDIRSLELYAGCGLHVQYADNLSDVVL